MADKIDDEVEMHPVDDAAHNHHDNVRAPLVSQLHVPCQAEKLIDYDAELFLEEGAIQNAPDSGSKEKDEKKTTSSVLVTQSKEHPVNAVSTKHPKPGIAVKISQQLTEKKEACERRNFATSEFLENTKAGNVRKNLLAVRGIELDGNFDGEEAFQVAVDIPYPHLTFSGEIQILELLLRIFLFFPAERSQLLCISQVCRSWRIVANPLPQWSILPEVFVKESRGSRMAKLTKRTEAFRGVHVTTREDFVHTMKTRKTAKEQEVILDSAVVAMRKVSGISKKVGLHYFAVALLLSFLLCQMLIHDFSGLDIETYNLAGWISFLFFTIIIVILVAVPNIIRSQFMRNSSFSFILVLQLSSFATALFLGGLISALLGVDHKYFKQLEAQTFYAGCPFHVNHSTELGKWRSSSLSPAVVEMWNLSEWRLAGFPYRGVNTPFYFRKEDWQFLWAVPSQRLKEECGYDVPVAWMTPNFDLPFYKAQPLIQYNVSEVWEAVVSSQVRWFRTPVSTNIKKLYEPLVEFGSAWFGDVNDTVISNVLRPSALVTANQWQNNQRPMILPIADVVDGPSEHRRRREHYFQMVYWVSFLWQMFFGIAGVPLRCTKADGILLVLHWSLFALAVNPVTMFIVSLSCLTKVPTPDYCMMTHSTAVWMTVISAMFMLVMMSAMRR